MLNDQALAEAVLEMSKGLIDADLGKGLVKKRIALPGRGKSGGARTLLATNKKDRWIFLFGFQKNEKGNITAEELYALQSLALDFLDLSEKQMDSALNTGELIEVFYDNQT